MGEIRTITKKWQLMRGRLLWVLIAAVWIFVILKFLVAALFGEKTSLVAAFSVSNPSEISATVEVTASLPGDGMTVQKMEEVLYKIAKDIRLTVTEEPVYTETESRVEYCYKKEAKAADTELRVICVSEEKAEGTEAKNYVYAKITLKEAMEPILTYKKILEASLVGLSCEEISTTLQLIGAYPGYLTLERRNEAAEKILKALGAEVVYEYRKEDLYTIYAYTASLENYITVEGNKINLHIAMSQDENRYRTILYLASPILPDTW